MIATGPHSLTDHLRNRRELNRMHRPTVAQATAEGWRVQRGSHHRFRVWRLSPTDEPQLRFTCSRLEYALAYIAGASGLG